MVDLKSVQKKWAKEWSEKGVFESKAKPGQPKYFVTFPYPYMNGFLHVGHLYSGMRAEIMARYKRHRGHNVLFPQGWHCTGGPIENAAQRIREKEEKQWKIMRSLGFDDAHIEKFGEPKYWTDFFPKEAKIDFVNLGFSVDFRRSFITTDLNPHYDKFIRWQFEKLREKEYVIKGRHPVVWDPKNKCPVGDHDRSEGEGETPQEFTLLKFEYEPGVFVVVATLRPETIFGQTNLWCGADVEYVKARVGDETWIISEPCAVKLEQQDKQVEVMEKIKGSNLLGKAVRSLAIDKELPILPSNFCNPEKGTGLVTSVPSDAPDDWMGLYDLQKDDTLAKKHGLDYEMLQAIKPIAIIDTPELGDMAAVKVCEDMGIKSQDARKKLDQAKKLVYKKGFYEGVMKEVAGEHAGKLVQDAKEEIKAELLEKGVADVLYELTGRVVSRSLTECIVKIVSNQWFLNYSSKEWKALAHECLDNMNLYPEVQRKQFDHVLDWLHDWACAREHGLGTRLPWDEKWVIESLSDSTIYMAYYTIAHLITKVPAEKLDTAFFDYVFYGKGAKPDVEGVDEMREEFDYWYPVDFRNSGKDLIQNHLAFFIFNHVAIFPKEKWPQGIGANGWVMVDGEKMSKSKGNFISLRDMAEKYSVDSARFTILSGGEGLDDANWDSSMAESMTYKLESLYDFVTENYNKGSRTEVREIDQWLESRCQEILRDTCALMDDTSFRTSLQKIYFEFQRVFKWYLRRCNNDAHKDIFNSALELQVLLLAPFCPAICEEMWSAMGKDGYSSLTEWPIVDESKIIPRASITESIVENVMEDVRTVKRIAKLDKLAEVTLFVSEGWKYQLFDTLRPVVAETRDFKQLLSAATQGELQKHAPLITKMIPKFIKGGVIDTLADGSEEAAFLEKEKAFFEKEFGCGFSIVKADDSEDKQANKSMPGKPSLSLK